MEAKILYWHDDELPQEIRDAATNNGCGKESACYLVFYRNGQIFYWNSDAMQPEDARFTRDLSWIKDLVLKAYQQGLTDGKAGEA